MDEQLPQQEERSAASQKEDGWGLLIYPVHQDGERHWELCAGWLEVDAEHGAHTLRLAEQIPELRSGDVTINDLSPHDQVRNHLAWVGCEHEWSLVKAVTEAYDHAIMLSEDRMWGEHELFNHLLEEWIWRMRTRGKDPREEMTRVLESARETSEEGYGKPSTAVD
jgi:hypothetical protein